MMGAVGQGAGAAAGAGGGGHDAGGGGCARSRPTSGVVRVTVGPGCSSCRAPVREQPSSFLSG